MVLALGPHSQLSLLENATGRNTCPATNDGQELPVLTDPGRLALRQRALLKLSNIIGARLT
jgi:hypothetical protein